MVKVKICGITNIEDAKAAVRSGCDALGFVFARSSPRYIAAEKARRIIEQLPPGVITIGVFVNARARTVRRLARIAKLKMLQFHGDESWQFCRRFRRYRVIKAFRISTQPDLARIARYKTSAYLFDAFSPAARGGTGKTLDWSFLSGKLPATGAPIFLAGGLHSRNVATAVRKLRPDWVDASSCLEKAPGLKDHRRMREFIRNAKKA